MNSSSILTVEEPLKLTANIAGTSDIATLAMKRIGAWEHFGLCVGFVGMTREVPRKSK